jgi:ABC-type multidrug transport system fused ATPase/permease subunit
MPNVSKYVIETTVPLGAMSIADVQFWLEDATHAVVTLSIFLAAGTRIAPAALRIQQGLIHLRTNMGTANPTLRLIEEFEYLSISQTQKPPTAKNPNDFAGFIEIANLNFTYPNNLERTIRNVSIKITQGEIVAFVGWSGAGKTTLVDLILGALNPDSDKVVISVVDPETAFDRWPGNVGYVPQDTFISNGSIRENFALGFDPSSFADSEIWDVLRIAQLKIVVRSLPDSLDTYIGDRGTRLSGGQRQRIGIARALLTNPKILFLDKATSSLDAETEDALSKAINGLKGQVTLIVIAHRLSTIKNADNIFYLENAEIHKSEKFEELKLSVPSFATQAQLMGL